MDNKLTIKVHENKNFTAEQLERYTKAIELTEIVINSKRFKKKLLEMRLTNTNGKTNAQIYQMMMDGAEQRLPEIDNEVDVFITMYYKNNKVVGYTYPSTDKTWVNSKFFNKYSYASIAANLIHEWLHKLGFGHRSASEHTSVPYGVGYLVRDLIKELIDQPELFEDTGGSEVEIPAEVKRPVRVCKRLWYTFWFKKVCWYK
jgi:hypothetical protein